VHRGALQVDDIDRTPQDEPDRLLSRNLGQHAIVGVVDLDGQVGHQDRHGPAPPFRVCFFLGELVARAGIEPATSGL
jgi:hypothetical protein